MLSALESVPRVLLSDLLIGSGAFGSYSRTPTSSGLLPPAPVPHGRDCPQLLSDRCDGPTGVQGGRIGARYWPSGLARSASLPSAPDMRLAPHPAPHGLTWDRAVHTVAAFVMYPRQRQRVAFARCGTKGVILSSLGPPTRLTGQVVAPQSPPVDPPARGGVLSAFAVAVSVPLGAEGFAQRRGEGDVRQQRRGDAALRCLVLPSADLRPAFRNALTQG